MVFNTFIWLQMFNMVGGMRILLSVVPALRCAALRCAAPVCAAPWRPWLPFSPTLLPAAASCSGSMLEQPQAPPSHLRHSCCMYRAARRSTRARLTTSSTCLPASSTPTSSGSSGSPAAASRCGCPGGKVAGSTAPRGAEGLGSRGAQGRQGRGGGVVSMFVWRCHSSALRMAAGAGSARHNATRLTTHQPTQHTPPPPNCPAPPRPAPSKSSSSSCMCPRVCSRWWSKAARSGASPSPSAPPPSPSPCSSSSPRGAELAGLPVCALCAPAGRRSRCSMGGCRLPWALGGRRPALAGVGLAI